MNPYAASQAGRNYGCRIREFVEQEHCCVRMENEVLAIVVCADKGADILEFLYKPRDMDFLWHAPGGLRNPAKFRQSNPLSQGNFREYFAGGWYEMLPNGPQPCSLGAAEWGQHGEATLLSWRYQVIEDQPDAVEVLFETDLVRIPLHVEKRLRLQAQSGTLTLRETIENRGGERVQFLWGQHPTFGWPFLEEGCRIYLPSSSLSTSESVPEDSRLAAAQSGRWPWLRGLDGKPVDLSHLPAPSVGSHDFVRIEEFDEGWFSIVNEGRGVGFALRWDATLFPVLGYWQLFRGGPGYPWYRSHYLAALEPASDLPSLAGSIRKGTALQLDPSQFLTTQWEATAFTAPTSVTRVGPGGDIR